MLCGRNEVVLWSKNLQDIHSSFLNSSFNIGIRRQKQSLLMAMPITLFLKLLKWKLTYLGKSGAWAWHYNPKSREGWGLEEGYMPQEMVN